MLNNSNGDGKPLYVISGYIILLSNTQSFFHILDIKYMLYEQT